MLESLARATRPPAILYLATHGVSDATDPLERSFIALAPEGQDAGRWTAREIQGTPMRGLQLAVLSACQTGLGRVHDAGMIGLARAFQLAGAHRVIMSLWNVDDQATARMMLDFNEALRRFTPSEALREATLKARVRDPNPFNWAGFALFGVIW